MTNYEKALARVRAREAGKQAARTGENTCENPYPETDDLHWQWLDAWCVEKSFALRNLNATQHE